MMIRQVITVLVVSFAFTALPALAQNTGPVRTVPNTAPPDQGPVRTVPNTPPPDQAAPYQARPDLAAPEQPAPDRPAQEAEDNRFIFHRVEDSFVRLDLRTGQVSLCSRRTVGWTCQVAPDDRNVLENEIARLRNDNSLLKKELLARGLPLPGGIKPTPPPKEEKSRELRLPNEADVKRVMSFIERAWHRLVEMIVNLQKDVMQKS
jgi:hypothetical protein